MPFRQYWKCLSASGLPGLKLPIAKKRLPYGLRHKQSLGTAFNRAALQLARLANLSRGRFLTKQSRLAWGLSLY